MNAKISPFSYYAPVFRHQYPPLPPCGGPLLVIRQYIFYDIFLIVWLILGRPVAWEIGYNRSISKSNLPLFNLSLKQSIKRRIVLLAKMISLASKMFSAPPQEVTFSGLLFDMDGTIVDSTEAVVKHWHRFVLQLYSLPFQGNSFKIPACFFYFVMLEGDFLSSYSYKFKWLTILSFPKASATK